MFHVKQSDEAAAAEDLEIRREMAELWAEADARLGPGTGAISREAHLIMTVLSTVIARRSSRMEIARLELKPGDVLVVKMTEALDVDGWKRLDDSIRLALIAAGHRKRFAVLYTANGVDLSVMRPTHPESEGSA